MLRSVFFQVMAMSVTGSALWLLLRALRPAAGRFCSASWQAGARLPVLAAFLLPVGLAAGAAGAALGRLAPGASPAEPALPKLFETAPATGLGVVWPQAAEAGAAPLWDAAFWLWLAGALSVCILAVFRQARFQRRLRRTRLPVEAGEAAALWAALGGGRLAALYTSSAVPAPLGAGLLRPAVYLPDAPLDGDALELVLRHELAHLARRDLWLKWAALAAAAVHWFNPLAWAFRRELSVLCEAACDEAAVRGLDGPGRRRYGELLLDALGGAGSPGGVCSALSTGAAGLKFRLRRLLRPVRRSRAQAVCTLLAAAVFCAFLPCAAAVQSALPPPAAAWDLADCRAWMARSNRKYEPLGLSYDADTDAFFYQGQRVALLLDERIMSPEERARSPWVTRSFNLFFVDRESENGPCLATIQDDLGRLTGLRTLPPGEAAEYLASGEEPVTYNSFSIQRGALYACDPAFDGLPAEIRTWAEECAAGAVAARLDGPNGYLCFPGLHCPWELSMNGDGVLEFRLYRLEGNTEAVPGVVRFAADRPVTGVRAWLDDVPLDVILE